MTFHIKLKSENFSTLGLINDYRLDPKFFIKKNLNLLALSYYRFRLIFKFLTENVKKYRKIWQQSKIHFSHT